MSQDEDAPTIPTPAPKPRPKGFAAMPRAQVQAIASKGGTAAHAQGTAHQFTPEEARAAGKKGGVAPHRTRGRGAGPRPKSAPSRPADEPEDDSSQQG
jgi:general stress protein YciG